jgi:hypothetical protein
MVLNGYACSEPYISSGKWSAALSVSLGPDLHELRHDAHSGHTITLNLDTWKVQVYLLCYPKTRLGGSHPRPT